MTVGPLEYIVIGFPDLTIDGSVAAVLDWAREAIGAP